MPAAAAFVVGAQAQSSFAAYTVPVPSNVRCAGLGLLTGSIAWNAVTPPSGTTVSYDVTQPNATVVNTTATSFALPTIVLIGSYRVQARITAGGWTSASVAITVTNVAGIYLCG